MVSRPCPRRCSRRGSWERQFRLDTQPSSGTSCVDNDNADATDAGDDASDGDADGEDDHGDDGDDGDDGGEGDDDVDEDG